MPGLGSPNGVRPSPVDIAAGAGPAGISAAGAWAAVGASGPRTREPHAKLADLELQLVEPGLAEGGREQVDCRQDRIGVGHQPSNRRKTRVALWPPKPKLLLMPTSTSTSRASCGT